MASNQGISTMEPSPVPINSARPAMRERRKRACRECRRQKVRCDVDRIGQFSQCSRCQRMELECDTLPMVDRNSRKTKAELQRDLDVLQRQLQETTDAVGTSNEISNSPLCDVPTMPAPMGPLVGGNGSRQSPDLSSSAPTCDLGHSTISAKLPTAVLSLPMSPKPIARELEGEHVEPRRIEECFRLFFHRYAPFLPILDSSIHPDEYYKLSEFLFWVIVYVGSRRYSGDPTLLGRLSRHISSLAFRSVQLRLTAIHTIQGLLLLSWWPPPINTMAKGLSHTLAGLALNLSLQEGLHVSGIGQDFSRVRLMATPTQKTSRAQLWNYCVIACQSISFSEGLVPMVLADSSDAGIGEDSAVSATFPSALILRRKIHSVLFDATMALLRAKQSTAKGVRGNLLSPLINLFDSQLTSLMLGGSPTSDKILIASARVHLQAFHFLENTGNPDLPGLISLYTNSCSLIDVTKSENELSECAAFFSMYLERSLMLAAYCILKCSRSSLLGSHLDLQAGERAYFSAILLLRQSSLQNDDLAARGAAIMSQLWSSSRVFRRSDGSVNSLRTRIQSRLSMSIVFDCFWWWRQEFGGQLNPYEDQVTASEDQNIVEYASNTPKNRMQHNLQHEDLASESCFTTNLSEVATSETFPDFDWAATFDIPLYVE